MRFRPGVCETTRRLGSAGESEVGLNEEMFDLSMAATSQGDIEQGDISMIFLVPDKSPAPDVSVTLDAAEVVEKIQAVTDDRQDDTQILRRLRAMAQVSIGLGAETTREALFEKVMDFIFDIFPTAERAFVVLQDGNSGDTPSLIPAVAATRESNREGDTLALSEIIIDEVVTQRRSILSTDAAQDQRFKNHESIRNLGIRSVMCVPLLLQNEQVDDEVTGIIQVDTFSHSHSFDQEDLQILTGIGAQVAIALKNFCLYEDIEQLFEGFVKASVHAIEARDPTTAGHSFRVAEYTRRLALAVDRCDQKVFRDTHFSPEQMRELRYAALLHDFGKVGVREHVLIKAKKLYHSEMGVLRERFRYARASLERWAYRELIDQHGHLSAEAFQARRVVMDRHLAEEIERLQRFMVMVERYNEPSVVNEVMPEPVREELRPVADFRFPGEEGESLALLTAQELDALTLARGSLTPKERREIQSHVSHTFALLNHIPWTGTLASVPDIAHAHHEKLDGTGYPLGLCGEQIPVQARIMAVTDIFDALTASDRPYKRSLNVEQALNILKEEARQGKVEIVLVDMFIESEGYQLFDVP
jgi:3',5'-cyclic-nucleotide phosphodiesterase